MPDLLDNVSVNVDKFHAKALEAQLEAVKPLKPFEENEEDMECTECGAPIPKARRRASESDLCVNCATFHEKQNGRVKKMRGEW